MNKQNNSGSVRIVRRSSSPTPSPKTTGRSKTKIVGNVISHRHSANKRGIKLPTNLLNSLMIVAILGMGLDILIGFEPLRILTNITDASFIPNANIQPSAGSIARGKSNTRFVISSSQEGDTDKKNSEKNSQSLESLTKGFEIKKGTVVVKSQIASRKKDFSTFAIYTKGKNEIVFLRLSKGNLAYVKIEITGDTINITPVNMIGTSIILTTPISPDKEVVQTRALDNPVILKRKNNQVFPAITIIKGTLEQ
jgi:hypothetical protein